DQVEDLGTGCPDEFRERRLSSPFVPEQRRDSTSRIHKGGRLWLDRRAGPWPDEGGGHQAQPLATEDTRAVAGEIHEEEALAKSEERLEICEQRRQAASPEETRTVEDVPLEQIAQSGPGRRDHDIPE